MLKVGNVIKAKIGKNSQLIGYDDCGKVVILNGEELEEGYVKILSIEEKSNCYIASAENVIQDVYRGIDYKTFLKVLEIRGFKVGFDRIFDGSEHQIFAYDLKTGMYIVAETFGKASCFNSIDLYIPNVDTACFKTPAYTLFSTIDSSGDSVSTSLTGKYASLEFMQKIVAKYSKSPVWKKNTRPWLWTYCEENDELSAEEVNILKILYNINQDVSELWIRTIDRILLADKEVEDMFEKGGVMEGVFKTRDN